jgi:hypothetical protein
MTAGRSQGTNAFDLRRIGKVDVPITSTSQKNGTGKNDEADGSLKWVI